MCCGGSRGDVLFSLPLVWSMIRNSFFFTLRRLASRERGIVARRLSFDIKSVISSRLYNYSNGIKSRLEAFSIPAVLNRFLAVALPHFIESAFSPTSPICSTSTLHVYTDKIMMANPTDKNVIIPKGKKVAKVSPISDEDSRCRRRVYSRQ